MDMFEKCWMATEKMLSFIQQLHSGSGHVICDAGIADSAQELDKDVYLRRYFLIFTRRVWFTPAALQTTCSRYGRKF